MDIYHSLEEIVLNIVKSDKQEEKHLIILLELFIAHIFANKTTALYVSIIIEQAEGHIKNLLSNTEKEQWFIKLDEQQRKSSRQAKNNRYFKNVSNAIKQLYFLLRASLNLDWVRFSQKYSYIPQTNFDMICVTARAVRREDYFLFGCISIAYQSTQGRGFEVTELIDTLSQCAAAELPNVIAKDLRNGHPLLETVKNTLMEKNKCFKKFSEEFKPTIVKMLKEYCAADNPFAQRFPALDKSLQNISLTTKDGALPYLLPKTKAPRMTRHEQCQLDVLNVLSTFENKPARSSIPDVSSSSSSSSTKAMSSNSGLLSAKPKVPRDVNPFEAVAQFLSKHKISKTQALQFFYNKKMRLNEMEDCIVSSQGFRTYCVAESNTNENEILAAGVLTCILHTIRLLFVGGLLEASNPQYSLFQSLLNKMVSKMNSWTVDEVLREINFNLSEMDPINRFESFVLKVSNEYPKLFTVLPTTTWSKFLTPESQQSSVEELYNSRTQRDQRASIFFLAFADAPSRNISLPYSFRCNSPSYTPISIDENGAIDPEKSSDGKTCLQLVGLIYAAKQYSFQFVTYSRSREDGQYQVFRLNQYGIVDLLHAVPYPESTRTGQRTYSLDPRPLLASDPSGKPLVGLILVRNDNLLEDENRHYLSEPVIQTIKDNCSYTTRTKVGFNNYCQIFGSSLKTLSSPTAWLKDEVIHGIINLMCDHLKSKHETTVANTFYLCTSLTYQNHICKRSSNLSAKALSDFRDSAFGVYIINMDNTHWICGCASNDLKTIYLLDSYNSKSSVELKAKEMISFFKECVGIPGYKYVMLPSSDQTQEDYYNCGVFTILNAIIFLKSIFEGSFDPVYLQNRTPRIFTPEDKITLRATMRRVLERTEEIGCLLQWI